MTPTSRTAKPAGSSRRPARDKDDEPQELRTDGLRQVALRAAIELLTQQGWDAVTQANVAERSGLGRATIYRYWPGRTDLVHDAVIAHMVITTHVVPTGDFRTDLLNELNDLSYDITEHDLGPVLAALVDRAEWEPSLRRIKVQITENGVSVVRNLVTEAVARGELQPGTDVDASISILVGPLLYRRLISGEPVGPGFAEWLVDNYIAAHGVRKRRAATAAR